MMDRRSFLKAAAAGLGVLFVPVGVPGLTDSEDKILVSHDWEMFDLVADAFVRAFNGGEEPSYPPPRPKRRASFFPYHKDVLTYDGNDFIENPVNEA